MKLAIVCALLVGILTLTGCELNPRPTPTATSLEQLIAILQDPESADFWFATTELAEMGPAAAPAAKILAKALRYPRRDSYMAGIALVSMGPAAGPAIPELVQALEDNRSGVRLFAAFILGTIGQSAKCAVPELALRLWDTDPWVRTAAAGALDAITGIDLVAEVYELVPSVPGSVAGDEPEGYITGKARAWWIGEGQYMDWAGESDLCKSGGP
jgi:HEAT repeat protein